MIRFVKFVVSLPMAIMCLIAAILIVLSTSLMATQRWAIRNDESWRQAFDHELRYRDYNY